MSIFKKKTVTTVEETVKVMMENEKNKNSMDAVAPKSIGKLDMVIAFRYLRIISGLHEITR